jgi:hypothetical protein
MLRRLISASATCAASSFLALSPLPAWAGPPDEGAPAVTDRSDEGEDEAQIRVEQGIEAWRKGEWTEVRDLLEPLVREGDIEDEFLRESALRYLAEATLLDEGLDPEERQEMAKEYIIRLLDSSPDWAPPSGLHGRPFYDLVAKVRSERDAQLAEACRGQLLSCEADLTELQVDYRAAQDKIAALREDLASEDVFLTEVVKRNRGLAFLPFGVGHLTNGNFALGGSFLALEVVTGAAGLGMLIYRTTAYGCVRTSGFNRKSLVCTVEAPDEDIPDLQNDVETLRNAEAVMGYVFLGALVLDITLAQVLFKPIEVVEKGEKTRRELDAEIEDTGPAPPAKSKREQSDAGVKLRLRPHPAVLPAGLGLGMTLQF